MLSSKLWGGKHREEDKEKIRALAVLPFCGSITNQTARKLWRWNIKTLSCTFLKLGQCLGSIKDSLSLNVPGIYKISCACGAAYIGQTRRNIAGRRKERERYLRLGQTDKS